LPNRTARILVDIVEPQNKRINWDFALFCVRVNETARLPMLRVGRSGSV